MSAWCRDGIDGITQNVEVIFKIDWIANGSTLRSARVILRHCTRPRACNYANNTAILTPSPPTVDCHNPLLRLVSFVEGPTQHNPPMLVSTGSLFQPKPAPNCSSSSLRFGNGVVVCGSAR